MIKVIYNENGVAGISLHETLYSPAALASLARDLDNERQAHAALRALVTDLCAAVADLQTAHAADRRRIAEGRGGFTGEGREIAEQIMQAHKRLIAAAIAIQVETI